jgi:hypothetical protein
MLDDLTHLRQLIINVTFYLFFYNCKWLQRYLLKLSRQFECTNIIYLQRLSDPAKNALSSNA